MKHESHDTHMHVLHEGLEKLSKNESLAELSGKEIPLAKFDKYDEKAVENVCCVRRRISPQTSEPNIHVRRI